MGNSFTLDDLFRVRFSTTFLGRELTLRALSDFDIQARDDFALRAVSTERKSLKDTASDAYAAFDWLEDATDEQLRNVILAVEQSNAIRQSFLDIQPAILPFPDDADEQEKTDVLAGREAEAKRVEDERAKIVEKRVGAIREQVATLEHDALVKRAKQAQVEVQLNLARTRAFDCYTLYAAVFKDAACQERFFPAPTVVYEMQAEIRQQLVAQYYRELERVTSQDLKYFLSTGGSPASSKPSNGSTETGVAATATSKLAA